MRSDEVKLGVERAAHRALLKADGLTDQINQTLHWNSNSYKNSSPGTFICAD
jgi:hypothetical protein